MWSNDPQSDELSTGDMYICHKKTAVENLQISSAKQTATLFFVECSKHLNMEAALSGMMFLKQGCTE